MAKTLAEYAAQNPQEMPPAEQEQQQNAATMKDRERERAQERQNDERLKASILAQLQQANEPQYILYTALEAIGLLTHDAEWAETGKACLDKIYDDLAQQSLLTDNAAIAEARTREMQEGYKDRLRRQLNKQLQGYHKIARGLNDALAALDELDSE